MELNTNQILMGDCFEIMQQIPDNSIDLIFSDPPFNILNKSNIKLKDRSDIVQTTAFDHFPSYGNYLAFIIKWVKLCYRKMKENAAFISFFANQYVTDLIRICEHLGMIRKNIMVWSKLNPAPRIRKTNFLSSFESMVFMVKSYPSFNFTDQNDMHNVFTFPLPSQEERLKIWNEEKQAWVTLHPTQKPLALIEKIILITTESNAVVCDPFAGTGTTNIACLRTGRYCLGIEKDSIFHHAAQERLSNASGSSVNKVKHQILLPISKKPSV